MSRLKQFALDAESLPKERRHEFALQTRCVSAHFERVFTGQIQGDAWKVLVDCVEGEATTRIFNLLGVFVVQTSFDFKAFDSSTVREKKEIALDALYRGVSHVATTRSWPQKAFADARNAIADANYENEWVWRQSWNGARTLHAVMVFRHDVMAFSATLEIWDRARNKLATECVVESQPSEFLFHAKFGKLRWTSRTEVSLFSKDGEVVASVGVKADC